ncbi:protein translocase subunit SecD [Candidatus Wolfebacteria bacterium]|nr:protein translocase subunit SecD [Candidatus Wolfebacteria bacterium]
MRSKYPLILGIVIVVAVAAAFFVVPKTSVNGITIPGLADTFLPWRLGLDLVGGTHLVYGIDMSQIIDSDRDSVMTGLRDVIEQRVNLFGVSEPQVVAAKEGDAYRLIVDLAGVRDIGQAIDLIGQTPLLEFYEEQQVGTSTQFVPTPLTGRYLRAARAEFDQTTGQPYVSLEFNDEGATIFEDITGRNVGKMICVAIDRQIGESDCARVQEKISGGQARLTGQFDVDEVRKIIERFNAGALPAPITLESQAVIGPSLGEESLRLAILAGTVGTGIIILFMLLYYRLFGVFAVLALVIYIPLTLAVFKVIPGFTLTLAGIAGFILSVGMAVDANILIFERTREELRRGVASGAAIDEGFKRAWPSIRDSNISTIITAFILYYFTTSFIKGFALALLVGVLVSMFSAITVTRAWMKSFIRS